MIIIGDCREKLSELDENSIDTCITDPPYELGFMGKSWDNAGVSFQKETWEAVYRVLKPGALLLAFGGTRTWHRIAVAIEDAGFEIRDTICWLYGQGFPKSYNIGKGIDKKAGKERKIIGSKAGQPGYSLAPEKEDGTRGNVYEYSRSGSDPNKECEVTAPATPEAVLWEGYGTSLKPAFEPIIVAMKPIDGTYVENALKHGVSGMWIDGGRITTNPEVDDPRLGGKGSWKSDKMAKNVYGGEWAGKDIASSPKGRWPSNVILDEESAEMLDEQTGISKGGFVRNRTAGARVFENEGKDTGYETVAEISEPDGGASRFFYTAKANKKERNLGLDSTRTVKYNIPKNIDFGGISCKDASTALVQSLKKATSELTAQWLIGESGASIVGLCQLDSLSITLMEINKITESKILNLWMRLLIKEYIADANCEKEFGGNHATDVENSNRLIKIIGISPERGIRFMEDAKNAISELLLKVKNEENWQTRTNIHSTVKPLALMEYLCKLTRTPTGGIVLDPFMGSGTTGMACVNTDRDFIGIELSEEYAEIAKLRIEASRKSQPQLKMEI